MTQLNGLVQKGWGSELIFATNDKYSGKLLTFAKAGSKFSMHFHAQKDESWYVLRGKFMIIYIDTTTSTRHEKVLETGDTWHNPPLLPHQLIALEDNSYIIEVSTPDSVEDNFRIEPGDSQNTK